MALPLVLAVAELPIGVGGLDGPGRNVTSGGRTAPRVWAVGARDGKGLTMWDASQKPTVAGPKTAGCHWCQSDDAGTGTIWTVHPVPARVSNCWLQPVVKLSWRRSYGGTLGPAGKIHARRTPSVHHKGV